MEGGGGVPFNCLETTQLSNHLSQMNLWRLPGASLPMLVNPSLMLEMSTAACLVKEEAPERSGWFRGSAKKREESCSYGNCVIIKHSCIN